MKVQPGHRVAGLVDRQTVEHRPAAVLVDEEIREAAAECTRDGRGDDQDQDRGRSLQQAGVPHRSVSQLSRAKGRCPASAMQ